MEIIGFTAIGILFLVTWQRISAKANEKVEWDLQELKDLILVEDYFKECPCCRTEKGLYRESAVKFEKLNYYWVAHVNTHFTSKESAKAHLTKINEWQKEVTEYRKSLKKD